MRLFTRIKSMVLQLSSRSMMGVQSAVLFLLVTSVHANARIATLNGIFSVTDNYKIPPETINGKVTDEKGIPLIGVTVHVKGTNSGTSTDARGSLPSLARMKPCSFFPL